MSTNGNRGRYECYACQGRTRKGKEHCDNDHLPRRPLELAVVGQLGLLLSQTDMLREAWAKRQVERAGSSEAFEAGLVRVRHSGAGCSSAGAATSTPSSRELEADLCQEGVSELTVEFSQLEARELALVSKQSRCLVPANVGTPIGNVAQPGAPPAEVQRVLDREARRAVPRRSCQGDRSHSRPVLHNASAIPIPRRSGTPSL
jgi:Recombinase zinc beta ribbon domain